MLHYSVMGSVCLQLLFKQLSIYITHDTFSAHCVTDLDHQKMISFGRRKSTSNGFSSVQFLLY